LFEDSSDELFTVQQVKKVDKASLKKKASIFEDSSDELFQASTSAGEPLAVGNELPRKASTVKSIGKNLVFGPGALATGGLFQKLSEKVGPDGEIVVDSDSLNPFAAGKVTSAAGVESVGDDIFGGIETDKAFSESALKNVQKV
jgi:hypothetical protein